MKATATKFETIDQYHASFPVSIQKKLQEMRKTIRKAAPKSTELISYNIPAFDWHGRLVYYAAFKAHIGFYPTSSGIRAFQKELSVYEGSKGAARFPLDKPLPLALITKIVTFRMKENLEKEKLKGKK